MKTKFDLPLILDGAWGSTLQERGMPSGVCPEVWILEHPDVLVHLQREYVAAGSGVVYAPTFGANRPTLERSGVYGKTAEINIKLVELTRSAVGKDILVAGDISPTGLQLPPYGSTTFDNLVEIFLEQGGALENAGVDLFAVETSLSLSEVRAAIIALREVSDKPILVSFPFQGEGRTYFGGSISSALITAQALGASAFGLNCCDNYGAMYRIFESLKPLTRILLLAKPNAGLPKIIGGKPHYSLPPETFAEFMPTLAPLGVGLFGGCCGTNPNHIRSLKKALEGVIPYTPMPDDDRILLASDRLPLVFSPDMEIGEVVCSDDLLEDVANAEGSGCAVIRLILSDEDDLALFTELQSMIKTPLILRSDNEDILRLAVRRYTGIALYDGEATPLIEELRKKYGLQII